MFNHYYSLGFRLSKFSHNENRDFVFVEYFNSSKLFSFNDFFDWASINNKTVDFIDIQSSLKNYLNIIHYNLVKYYDDFNDVNFNQDDIDNIFDFINKKIKRGISHND